MKKNSGQVLVLFILILPILFMILGLVIDVGLSYLEKRKVDNVINEAIYYALNDDNNVLDNTRKYIQKNIDNIDNLNVSLNDNIVEIKLSKRHKSLFANIFKKNDNLITANWFGYKDNDKIKIEKQ